MTFGMNSSLPDDAIELCQADDGGHGRFASRSHPQLRTMRLLLEDFKRNKGDAFFPDNALTPVNSLGYRSIDEENRQFIGSDIMHSALARKLKGRHLQMIAISGSIGTGLFIMTGQALATGGPASMLLAFTVVGINMYCTCHALGELAVVFPIAGSFSSWATRFLDPSWGFALGWKYVSIYVPLLSSSLLLISTRIRL